MTSGPSFHAIIVAAGRGERSGMAQPKQFAALAGKPVLRWSAETFRAHPACKSIVIVAPDDADGQILAAQTTDGLACAIVSGGATRQQSVANGIAALPSDAGDDAIIMVHDAARPGLDHAVIDRLLAAFADPDVAGTVPVLAVVDTLVQCGDAIGDVVPRDQLAHVQTPQAFRAAALRAAHIASHSQDASDDAQLVRAAGGRVVPVAGSRRLAKLTYAEDFTMLEHQFAPNPRIAVGSGYDVHGLVDGDGVWLGGIHIPHDRRLDGHSDADVLLHAITDALLGTISAGDIGMHFPPSDPQWQGAASARFLEHAGALVRQGGGRIMHVDCTIICEAPKIGPHRDAMVASIAGILGMPHHHVSVKATTTEKLGFTGRGEGIAAQATATVAFGQ